MEKQSGGMERKTHSRKQRYRSLQPQNRNRLRLLIFLLLRSVRVKGRSVRGREEERDCGDGTAQRRPRSIAKSRGGSQDLRGFRLSDAGRSQLFYTSTDDGVLCPS
ncbi:hypothetical protein ROHU_000439 [Labeo rohita]|uniref:Uncharacterized protein n=1 Tax=Labeo rohita TaxID=84645 RepID=A0A498P4N1_LABRO|nr:hypothetical protein ROHU_000439 [Labeo rohita]